MHTILGSLYHAFATANKIHMLWCAGMLVLMLILAILFAALLPIRAQVESAFTRLDWAEMHIDSVLPVYSEVVPLESDWRSNSYSVQLEFPEYAPLSRAEARRVPRER